MPDLICIIILIIFMLSGRARGLARSAFGMAAAAVSMYLTYTFFPAAVRILRMCGVYAALKRLIEQTMDPQGAADEAARRIQTEFIKGLPQSSFILERLQANNNPEAYAVLDVSSLSGYIAGYFANMAVNLIAILLLYIIIRILLSLVFNIIDALTRLPVLNMLNRLGGALFGLAQGLLFVWIALCVMTFIFLNAKYADLFNQIESGALTGFLYDNNPIMNILVTLIPQ
ncbi:MAG: CvpA family protein [Clostridiales bacterium]|jgi:uncharacterized membrane protein required for colicin V production|nr:CvpA family protein [Clostridiales bacterium]